MISWQNFIEITKGNLMSHPKKGIKWWIFNRFGPPEVCNLIDHIDTITADGDEIAIYPAGEFIFSVKISESSPQDPFVFSTEPERKAFALGLNFGISLFGGTTTALSKEDFEEINKMEKKATHSGGGGRKN